MSKDKSETFKINIYDYDPEIRYLTREKHKESEERHKQIGEITFSLDDIKTSDKNQDLNFIDKEIKNLHLQVLKNYIKKTPESGVELRFNNNPNYNTPFSLYAKTSVSDKIEDVVLERKITSLISEKIKNFVYPKGSGKTHFLKNKKAKRAKRHTKRAIKTRIHK
jgi:hypothetical protein